MSSSRGKLSVLSKSVRGGGIGGIRTQGSPAIQWRRPDTRSGKPGQGGRGQAANVGRNKQLSVPSMGVRGVSTRQTPTEIVKGTMKESGVKNFRRIR